MKLPFRFWAALALLLALMSGPLPAAQIDTFGKLEIKADDGSFSARLTGRVHVDANFYSAGSDRRELPSGAFIRRARFGMQGNFHEYEYSIDVDNAAQQSKLQDAVLRRLIGSGKLSIGQFKVFESLEQINSSNDITFMERSYVGDSVPGFKIGAAYNGTLRKVGYSANIYNLREASDDEARPTNAGLGVVGRGYFMPINQRNMALHFGLSYAREHSDRDGLRARVSPLGRAQEYRNEDDFRFVLFDRQDMRTVVSRTIAELAAINGPLSVQGEYMHGAAETRTMAQDDFSAWYAQVSYVLTGEWRRYKGLIGQIDRPEPSRAWGAIEIAARHQRAKRDKVANAELTATEFGVTYYANANVRFMVNYGIANNKLIDDRPALLSTRAQFDF